MSLLHKLERTLRGYAVPNVTFGLVAAQVLVYGFDFALQAKGENLIGRLLLIPHQVLAGEVWRLVTFLIVPPVTNIFFAIFFWYLFYLMGTALEHHWGDFRYNVYLLIGYLATVAVSFLVPDLPSSNGFLQGSVFLAFAYLYPEFELMLFFILPVKIKWLALLAWIGYFLAVAFGGWLTRLLVLASVCNFFLFFGKDVWARIRQGRRRMKTQAALLRTKKRDYFHRCLVCGITDRTDPKMDFRYCDKCVGSCGYCTQHIYDHEHVTAPDTASR